MGAAAVRAVEGLTETADGDDENGVSSILAIPPSDGQYSQEGQNRQHCRATVHGQPSVR